MLSRVVARLLRLPAASAGADMRLTIDRADAVERWTRTFDGVRVGTEQRRIAADVIAERFGCLEFRFRIEEDAGVRRYRQTDALVRFGPIDMTLPDLIAPRIEALERETGPRECTVRVLVTWPPAGLILAYDGDVQFEDPFA